MKITITKLAAIGALAIGSLAACPAVASAAFLDSGSAALLPGPPFSPVDSSYLGQLRESPSLGIMLDYGVFSPDEAIEKGHTACAAIPTRGYNAAHQAVVDRGLTEENATLLIRAAIWNYCPVQIGEY
ncbi:DUF732 domain-containing protein [Aldersonia sp. NBC_00410]|uniref:DUF732 domain-containing protein n=1 Tax=Aldersonia sp. NBC_00410 TaxID=2975954 RepID=UPI0022506F2E|nr:DUF732 domain-containing protein [Aldersonia sp. NBC_00410]MCX5044678.1 DUF732 domain-containing protein [Aldersonia sp. NBC_00410]